MSSNARAVPDAFDSLPPNEQQELVAEILRRLPDHGELTEQDLAAAADELFLKYDAVETADASGATS